MMLSRGRETGEEPSILLQGKREFNSKTDTHLQDYKLIQIEQAIRTAADSRRVMPTSMDGGDVARTKILFTAIQERGFANRKELDLLKQELVKIGITGLIESLDLEK